ncbi:hypothetical protein F9278_34605 [Streptomyces phaeolivaceus]|uniref:Uncharacterized protein n=1 Tax=Streptomyces phaeolivaceus TaxID=2653200 RepID=A0A5P8KBR7_9ACTN|nr:hypothetical protein [Streptomyces phaeolivaceus]QFR00461.1 hypothetical protein F9278_34605 [Streptomyces phaeolivaceus]
MPDTGERGIGGTEHRIRPATLLPGAPELPRVGHLFRRTRSPFVAELATEPGDEPRRPALSKPRDRTDRHGVRLRPLSLAECRC